MMIPACALLVCMVFISGCKIQPITVQRIHGVTIANGAGGIHLNTLLTVHNPNRHRFGWRSCQMDIRLQGTEIGNVEMHDKVMIPAQDSAVIPVEVQTSLPTLGLAILPVLSSWMSGKPLEIGINGVARVRYGFFRGKMTVNYSQKVFPAE